MMPTRSIQLAFAAALFLTGVSFAEDANFKGRVTADNINVRTDATVASQVITTLSSGERVEAVEESYGWYKIRLPIGAPAYIRKDLAAPGEDPADSKKLKVIKESVNVRLRPNDSSPIIGRVEKNEELILIEEKSGWFRVEPPKNSFGWVATQFVARDGEGGKE